MRIFLNVQSELSVQSMTKNMFSLTTILKLFTNQSEVSAAPVGLARVVTSIMCFRTNL